MYLFVSHLPDSMRITLLVLIISLLYQVWGNKKYFIIKTKDDHRQPSMTMEGSIETDYSVSPDDLEGNAYLIVFQ